MPYNLNDTSVRYSELERAAKEIAAHMGRWEFVKDNNYNCLEYREYRLYVETDKTDKRIRINASHNLHESLSDNRHTNDRYFGNIVPGSYNLEITVSANKEPSAIAKDISKRLIPDYIELYERCKKIFLENKNRVNKRVEFAKKAAAILDCNPPKLPANNEVLRISERLTIDSKNVSISCDTLYDNNIQLENVSDDLLLEILTILTDKAGTTVYETWVAKEKASYLFKLGYELGITELPPIDWRKAYSERWDYSRTIETLKLAISPQQEDFMTSDQQELELATTADYEDDDCDDDDEVSDRVLELLAHIESLDFLVIDILELITRLTAIAIEKRNVELAEQEEEPDTDDDEEYEDEDEDQE